MWNLQTILQRERALSPVVIKRKISQQSRGIENMESYAMQASMFMTLKQQDRSYSQYLNNLLSEYLGTTNIEFLPLQD